MPGLDAVGLTYEVDLAGRLVGQYRALDRIGIAFRRHVVLILMSLVGVSPISQTVTLPLGIAIGIGITGALQSGVRGTC